MTPIAPPNAEALQRKAPGFLAWVHGAEAAHVELSPHGTEETLVVEGIHLASALEPAREAEFLAEHGIPEKAPVAYVYGTGRALIEAALARAERLIVVGLSARATAAELAHQEHPWLSDARIELRTPAEEDRPQTPRVISTAELRLAEPSALRDTLMLELAHDRQQEMQQGRVERRVARARDNRARFREDVGIAPLLSRGKPTIAVAAGGPSLSAGLRAIAPRRNQLTLIAVTTALASVEAAGLVPDVVIAVDPAESLTEHLDALRDPQGLAQIPLVYALDAHPEFIARWPGPRHAVRLDLDGYVEVEPATDFGSLFCSGTVTHAAVDLAVQMGARDVVLLGADFSHPGGMTHAAEAAHARGADPSHLEVQNVAGQRVPTNLNLLGYLRDLEDYIAQCEDVRFWNASDQGARIAGAGRYAP